MGVDFTAAERSRVGLEWEVACVDRRSEELSPAAQEILAKAGPAQG